MIIHDFDAFLVNYKEALLEISTWMNPVGKSYPTDLLTNTIINRAMAINDAYFRLIKLNNLIAAAPYIRMQMDNCIHVQAMLMVDETKLMKLINHFVAGKELYKFKDAKKNQMYEKYVVQELNKTITNFKATYEKYNDVIHLSNQHFIASHYMVNGHMRLPLCEGDFYNQESIDSNNKTMWLINGYLYNLLRDILSYKLWSLEQIEKRKQEENISHNRIMSELLEGCPELINLLQKNKGTD